MRSITFAATIAVMTIGLGACAGNSLPTERVDVGATLQRVAFGPENTTKVTGSVSPQDQTLALYPGETRVIGAMRAPCRATTAPTFRELMEGHASRGMTISTGITLSDGGRAQYESRRCRGETPARAIQATVDSTVAPGSTLSVQFVFTGGQRVTKTIQVIEPPAAASG